LSTSVPLTFRLRKPLSFHAVSFGNANLAYTLQRMARLAREIQNNAPQDPLLPAAMVIPSSYTTALDTVSTCVVLADEGLQLLASVRYGLRRHSWDLQSR
jgi:hypothetical protein